MQGPRSYWGEGGEEHVTSDGVKFEFSKTIGETNGTDTDHGQIPGLIFSYIDYFHTLRVFMFCILVLRF
jgi:hypothetical protein